MRDGRRRAAEASGARRENSGGRGGKRGRRAAEARGAQSVNSRGWIGSGARRGARQAAHGSRRVISRGVGRGRCEARRYAPGGRGGAWRVACNQRGRGGERGRSAAEARGARQGTGRERARRAMSVVRVGDGTSARCI